MKERVRREELRDTSTAFEEELKEKQATVKQPLSTGTASGDALNSSAFFPSLLLKPCSLQVLDTFGVTESDVQVALEAQKEDPSVRLKLGAIRRIAIQYT